MFMLRSSLRPASLHRHASAAEAMGRKKGKNKKSQPVAETDVDDADVHAETLTGLEEKLGASLERLRKDFGNIHAGRASPDLLAKVTVEAYGQREPLVKVAQVTVKDAQTLNANVFDPSLVKAVAAAIQGAGLQLNPQIVGSAVKIPIPRVTSEYREQLAKQVSAAAEEAKIAARKHRHDMLAKARKLKDSLSKDAMFRLEEDLTKVTNDMVKRIGEETEKKTKEVLKD